MASCLGFSECFQRTLNAPLRPRQGSLAFKVGKGLNGLNRILPYPSPQNGEIGLPG